MVRGLVFCPGIAKEDEPARSGSFNTPMCVLAPNAKCRFRQRRSASDSVIRLARSTPQQKCQWTQILALESAKMSLDKMLESRIPAPPVQALMIGTGEVRPGCETNAKLKNLANLAAASAFNRIVLDDAALTALMDGVISCCSTRRASG